MKSVSLDLESPESVAQYDDMMQSRNRIIHFQGISYLAKDVIWSADSDEWAFLAFEYPTVTLPFLPVVIGCSRFHEVPTEKIRMHDRSDRASRSATLDINHSTLCGYAFRHKKGNLYRMIGAAWSKDFEKAAVLYVPLNYENHRPVTVFSRTYENFYEDNRFVQLG